MRTRPGPAARARRARRLRGVLVFIVAAVVMIAAIFAFFLFPPRAEPVRADVVVVLAGADDGRHELAARLIEDGIAENLVVSNPIGPKDVAGSSLCRGSNRPEQAETWCMEPLPVTTTGETQTFDHIAQHEGWDTVVVVTSRPHTHRVRVNFEQCTDAEATVVSIDHVVWGYAHYHVAREIGGFLKHWITGPC